MLDRDEDKASRRLVLMPLMDGRSVEARTVVLDEPNEMVEALTSASGSIGYTALGLLRDEESERVKILDLDGVTPSAEAVARDEYPWSLTFSLVCREDASPAVREFVEFVTGPEGRRLVEENGYATS